MPWLLQPINLQVIMHKIILNIYKKENQKVIHEQPNSITKFQSKTGLNKLPNENPLMERHSHIRN